MTSAVTYPHSLTSSSCLMLPYGYQIDLDFIKYCENLTQPELSDVELQRRQRRRQRQSMEVMLGIQLEMQHQMDELSEFWESKSQPPEPPPRTHIHSIEPPSVSFYAKHQKQGVFKESLSWDPCMNDVVHDFEKTLERSKNSKDKKSRRGKDREVEPEKLKTGDCIPLKKHSKYREEEASDVSPQFDVVTESDDKGKKQESDNEIIAQRRIRDLEQQTKLIPLLQLQIQALKDERQSLQSMLESRASSSSSTSPQQHQPVFQAHRVSPVSLNSYKLPPVTIPKRTVGTSTVCVLQRDVGCSPADTTVKTTQRGTITDFSMKIEGDGGRFYTEKDLKKAIEMAHAKMRKVSVTVGTQCLEAIKEKPQQRTIGCGSLTLPSKNASCNTDEQNLSKTMVSGIDIKSTINDFRSSFVTTPVKNLTIEPLANIKQPLMTTTVKGISIAPEPAENSDADTKSLPMLSKLSLKDLNKMPLARSNATQTINPTMYHQSTQSTPCVVNKTTDSNDLFRLAHKMSMTESAQKRDQITHTTDLVKVHQMGVNTIQPVLPIKRSTASNTTSVTTKNVGINCDTQHHILEAPNLFQSSSKIPRPSPTTPRKFVRQETFTVTQNILKSDDIDIKECPAEKLLKLTMTQSKHTSSEDKNEKQNNESNLEMHKDLIDEPVKDSPSEALPEQPSALETSKMPMSPSIEYLDDDDFDEEEDVDDKFNDEQVFMNMPLRPPPTSISTIRLSQQNRIKIKPSKEMIAALKVLNDHLQKSPEPNETQIRNAREVGSCEWFKISSTELATSDNVEDYLDFFEEQSWDLLTFMVNLADKNGNTALHYAVSHGNFDVVSILLDSKVTSINQTNNAGYTCVMLVSLAKLLVPEHRTVVQRLFKLADVNIRATKNSQTALMLAVSHGNLTIASMLVEASADINIQDDDGSTALMCAAEHGYLDIVKFLLAQPDCDSTKVDVDGNTALKISLEAGYHDIGCLLYAHEHLLRNKASLKRTSLSRKSSTSSLN